MVMMEPIECGARQRKDRCNSTEVMFSSPVSTSCGGSPTSQRNNVSFRAELEVNAASFCNSPSDYTFDVL